MTTPKHDLWIKIDPPRQIKVTMEANTFKCPHCPCYFEGEECCGWGERKSE